MFELEAAIENWNQAFGKSDVMSAEGSSELEEHLRELIVDLNKCGLSQREAFIVGTDRLGHPSELEQEFAKVSVAAQWRRRVFWMLAGYIGMTVFGAIVSAVVAITGTGMAMAGVGGTVSGVVMNAVMLLAWIGIPVVTFRQLEPLGVCREHLSVKWLVAVGAVLIVAPIVTFGGRIAQARLVASSWYGESMVYLNIGQLVIHLCIVALCFVALCKFSEPSVRAVD